VTKEFKASFGKDQIPKVKKQEEKEKEFEVIYPFEAENDVEITVNSGDVVVLVHSEGGWAEVEYNGQRGLVPSSFLQEKSNAPKPKIIPQPTPQLKQEEDEEEEEEEDEEEEEEDEEAQERVALPIMDKSQITQKLQQLEESRPPTKEIAPPPAVKKLSQPKRPPPAPSRKNRIALQERLKKEENARPVRLITPSAFSILFSLLILI